VVDADSVAVALTERIGRPWEGSASDLLHFLTSHFTAENRPLPRDWPDTPEKMAGRLKRLAPSLRAIGWTVERGERTRYG
jgi:hypothetical protein